MAKLTIWKGRHYLDWRDPSEPDKDGRGKRRRLPLGKVGTVPRTQLDAILKAKEFELSTAARLLHAHRRPAPTLEQFATEYLLWHKGEYPDSHFRVAQIVDQHLLPEFGPLPMNLITVERVDAWKHRRMRLVAAGSVTKEFRTLVAMMNRAVRLKKLEENPIKEAEPPKDLVSKPHHWFESKADRAKLYRQSAYGPLWKFLANTGLRRGEAMNLRTEWINRKARLLRVESTGEDRTKAGEWRSIPLTDGAMEALRELDLTGEYVFPRMALPSLSRACARDIKSAGLKGSLHSLRHTYICHLLVNNTPIRTVQLYAGHAHITTTEKYAYQVMKAKAPTLRLVI